MSIKNEKKKTLLLSLFCEPIIPVLGCTKKKHFVVIQCGLANKIDERTYKRLFYRAKRKRKLMYGFSKRRSGLTYHHFGG